jgi:hypothetical protein
LQRQNFEMPEGAGARLGTTRAFFAGCTYRNATNLGFFLTWWPLVYHSASSIGAQVSAKSRFRSAAADAAQVKAQCDAQPES